jgi:GNAT superfamily N-acetyltransferase
VKVLREKLRPAGRLSLGPARPADAPAIGAILSDWIDETDWMVRVHRREEEQVFARDLVARGWVTVARRSGQVAGFLARDGEDVVALYVAGPARGQGVGSALLARAKRQAPRLWLWTFQFNHPARAFYTRHGFVEVERTGGAGNDEKLPDIRYQWRRGGGSDG